MNQIVNNIKGNRCRIAMVAFMLLYIATGSIAGELPDTVVIDDRQELWEIEESLEYTRFDEQALLYRPVDSLPLVKHLPGWALKLLDRYLAEEEDKTREKRIDLGFGVLPNYSREASIGLSASLTGLYRINRNDTLPQPSMFYASASASVNAFFSFKTYGNIYMPNNRLRLYYKAELSQKNLGFWGITNFETLHNSRSHYRRRLAMFEAEAVYRLVGPFFIGFNTVVNYTEGMRFSRPSYLMGSKRGYFVTGLGLALQFDTRDSATEPSRGVFMEYRPTVFPRFMTTAPYFFQQHRAILDIYVPTWRGAVLACDFYGQFGSEYTPWTMREMAGSDGIRLRGYYTGRYIDNNQLSAQIELRQHVWDRLGAVAWIGGATLFHKVGHASLDLTRQVWLPNGGIGLRLKIKPRLNARVDLGFAKTGVGLLVTVGEAF